jgi:hypothetical protein
MISSTFDQRLKFQQLFWFALIGISAVAIGFFLASNLWLMAFGVTGFLWMILLPYHSRISIYLSVATFSSALIVPLFPGRPYMWEFAALLGWSGLIITISMRKYVQNFTREVKENRWIFIGLAGYVLVLMATMFYRGFGLRILGSEQMGGRFYFQQLTCAIFPWLFIMSSVEEKTLIRLFILQCLLTLSYLVSDFILSRAPEGLFFLLQFFELSGDAVNFELRAARFGIRRYQSLYIVSSGLFCLVLTLFSLRDFFNKKALLLIPTVAAVLGVGLLSGHRYLAIIVVGVFVFCAYAQRFFDMKNSFVAGAAAVLILFCTYGFADRLPLAVQRALSVLPGISIDTHAKQDGDATFETRRQLRRIGLQMIPDYFWTGRGFGLATTDYSWQWDPTSITTHINQGRFFNGFIGLMVNTGVFGTLFMLIFLGGGTLLAWRVLQYLRLHGCDDSFTRLCAVISGLWIANTVAFLVLHGDSEYAMKTFSLQAGFLLACHVKLKQRAESLAAR